MEIQSGAVAKSYIRKSFLIYEEMWNYFPIYEEAVSHIWLCNCSILNFLIYEENLIFFFNSVESHDCILIDPQAWTPAWRDLVITIPSPPNTANKMF